MEDDEEEESEGEDNEDEESQSENSDDDRSLDNKPSIQLDSAPGAGSSKGMDIESIKQRLQGVRLRSTPSDVEHEQGTPLPKEHQQSHAKDSLGTKTVMADEESPDTSSPQCSHPITLRNKELEKSLRSASDKSTWKPWSSSASNLTKADYLMSPPEVYKQFALRCLEDDKNLDILSLKEDPSLRQIEYLPSWTPDFSAPPTMAGLRPFVNYMDPESCLYRAGGRTDPTHKPCFSWSPEDPSTLRVTGKIFESVRFVDTSGKFPPPVHTWWGEVLDESWLEMRDIETRHCRPGRYHTRESCRRALWRTLVGDSKIRDDGEYIALPIMRERFEAFLLISELLDLRLGDQEETRAEYERRGRPWDRFEEDARKYGEFLGQMTPIMQTEQRFFIANDQWFGVGPKSIREDDFVCVLKGAKVPFVVRSATQPDGPEAFELIGECYVHGIMNGEAMEPSPICWQDESLHLNYEMEELLLR